MCASSMTPEVVLILAALLSFLLFLLTGDRRSFGWDATEFDEWHHMYLGLLLVAAGLVLDLTPAGFATRALGVALMVDDAFQHAVKTFLRDPAYLSPLARLFAVAYGRVRAIRWLTDALDDLCWNIGKLFGS